MTDYQHTTLSMSTEQIREGVAALEGMLQLNLQTILPGTEDEYLVDRLGKLFDVTRAIALSGDERMLAILATEDQEAQDMYGEQLELLGRGLVSARDVMSFYREELERRLANSTFSKDVRLVSRLLTLAARIVSWEQDMQRQSQERLSLLAVSLDEAEDLALAANAPELPVSIKIPCPECQAEEVLVVPSGEFIAWRRDRTPVQEAFPSTPASERELLISGFCPSCFAKLAPTDE